ncbi:MAG: substrate-binding domain-containing protein [Desulforhopalus sp.]|nr:substrate-binding domain-containing protein [Desulforhopalus sp.]
MRNIILTIALAVFTLIGTCSPTRQVQAVETSPGGGEKMIFAGSGVNLSITKLLADAFIKQHPRTAIEIPGSIGTRGAIKAVADKAIHLGLISRSLKEEEKRQDITEVPYAQVAIVIAANSRVAEDTITTGELIAIIDGKKNRWQNGSEIIVQVREKSDSGFQVLENSIPGFKEAYVKSQEARRWTMHFTDQEANKALASTPFALGVTDLGMISAEQLPVKVLKLNGIAPDPENLRNGSYPLSRQLSFIYNRDNLPEEAKNFMRFVFSDAGRTILQAHGYLPMQ